MRKAISSIAILGALAVAAIPLTALPVGKAAAQVKSGAPAGADHVSLHFQWVGMIDNSEGGWGGPIGNFHYQVFVGTSKVPAIHGILYGPSDYEWRDGDERSYPAFMIHKWQAGQDEVRVKIWESDHGGGRDDVVLDQPIRRQETMGEGTIAIGPKTDMTERPAWLTKLPANLPHDRKAYFHFVTRMIEPGATYRWVHVGYGDIPHNDSAPSSDRHAGGPQPSRASSSTVGLGAVCPWDDPSKCHYKTLSALEVIGGRGKHPGEVYECIGPSCYRWVLIGKGDIPRHDLGSGPVMNGVPDPTRCNANTVGLGAVIADDDPLTVHYKDLPAEHVLNGGGKHPGGVYKCTCEQGN